MSTCICNVNWSVYNLGFDVIHTLNNSTSDMLTWFCVCDVFTWLSRGVGVNKCCIFCIRHFQMGPCCNPACSCIQGHSCPQWGVQGDEPCWLQGQISGPALLPTGFVSVSLFIYAYKRWVCAGIQKNPCEHWYNRVVALPIFLFGYETPRFKVFCRCNCDS